MPDTAPPLLVPPGPEHHRSGRGGWLRASVLGANDGLISTSSLLIGIALADAGDATLLMTGVAAITAGAFSMAAGEYVSVSSQADTEAADAQLERRALAAFPEAEHAELAQIYVERGLEPALAAEVARQLMAHDALGAHLRDELHLSDIHAARPLQAALASAAAFTVGGAPALALAWAWLAADVDRAGLAWAMAGLSLAVLGGLGAIAAQLGGAPKAKGAARVILWGALAMGATALIGHLFGASVA